MKVVIQKTRASRGRPSLERAAEIGNLVIDAAILAFVEQGLDISIEQIAQSVGVSKQAIYRRWPSKIHLLMDVMDQVMDKVYFNLSDNLPEEALPALKELSWRMCKPDGGIRERSLTILMSEALHDRSLHVWLESWRESNFNFYLPYVAATWLADPSSDHIALMARMLRDTIEGVSRDCYWSKLSDSECELLFLRKWDALSKVLWHISS